MATPSRKAATPAAFLFEHTWRVDTASQTELLRRLREAGVGRIITETWHLDDNFIERVHSVEMEFWVSTTWFSDHVEPVRNEQPELWPIDADGRPRSQLEWYVGLSPASVTLNDRLVERAADLAAGYAIDGLCLDFFRWPTHWELEFRPGATPTDSSFDDLALAAYRAHGSNLAESATGHDAARWILDHELERWVAFKCDHITRLARRTAQAIRDRSPALPVGLFVVPGDEHMRRRYAGQDVTQLAPIFDVLLPMLYHRIVQRDTAWVGESVKTFSSLASNTPVWPVVQISSTHPVSGGWDWGAPMVDDEAERVIASALSAVGHGNVVYFPGEALLDKPPMPQPD